MENSERALEEELIIAWVRLTGALKNNRLTQGMNYNEAIVMNIVYRRFLQDGEGIVPFKEIVAETRMVKSLVNRTIGELEKKRLLERVEGADKRTTLVRPVRGNLDEFLRVHAQSLSIAREVVSIIGEEDAATFVRIAERLVEADPLAEK